jgi:hypothetical protein
MWDGLQIVKHVLDAGATIKVLDFPGVKMGPPFKLTEHQCTLAGKGMAAGIVPARLRAISTSVTTRSHDCGD